MAVKSVKLQEETSQSSATQEQREGRLLASTITEVESLNIVTLIRSASLAKKCIWIMDNWIGSDVKAFSESVITALKNNPDLFVEAVFADPLGRSGSLRLDDLNLGSRNTINPWQVFHGTLVYFFYLKKAYPERVNIRFHQLLPSAQFYLFDRAAYVGFYFHRYTSRDSVQLLIDFPYDEEINTPLAFHLKTEFDYLRDPRYSQDIGQWLKEKYNEWCDLAVVKYRVTIDSKFSKDIAKWVTTESTDQYPMVTDE